MHAVIDAVLGLSGWTAYVTAGVLVFGEAAVFAGIVLPGETVLLVGGALVATGRLSLPGLMVVAIAAAILGDSTGYEVGRRCGPALRHSRLGRLVGVLGRTGTVAAAVLLTASVLRHRRRRGQPAEMVGGR